MGGTKIMTSVSYYIKVNSLLSEEFYPERGDPLSPYLFVICMEWLLTCALLKYQAERSLLGVRQISEILPRILERFQQLSGQKLNLEKSSIFMGKNVSDETAEQLSRLLNIQRVATITKYLGMPIIFNNNKLSSFKEKAMEKGAWLEGKIALNSRYKEILIKSILQCPVTKSPKVLSRDWLVLFSIFGGEEETETNASVGCRGTF
ncbi:hypothetical protein QQ045_021990 [Rhodiola kirilowii]